MRLTAALLSLYVALDLLRASSALAADPAELRIRQGVEMRRKGRDADALSHFVAAYEISKSARAAAQLGLCEQSLSMWEHSEQHLSEALTLESDPWISRNKDTLLKAREAVRRHLALVKVDSNIGDALVSVNGQVIGKVRDNPSIWLLPGEVSVVVSHPSFDPIEERHLARAGIDANLRVELVTPVVATDSQPPTTLSSDSSQAALPGSGAENVSAPIPDRNVYESVNGSWRRYVGWSTIGLGVAGAGLGIFGVLSRERAVSDFNNDGCSKKAGRVDGGTSCLPLDGDVGRYGKIALFGFVSSAVFVAVGTTLLLLPPGGPTRNLGRSAPNLVLSPSLVNETGLLVHLRGSY